MTQENRRAPRRPLIASAELIDIRTEARLKARTSDVSTVGCYLDTMTTLPAGTGVWLAISHNEETVTVLGIIANSQPHMGIRFTDVSSADHKVLEGWLAALEPRTNL
jgi:PilZ domain-containing protein